MLKKLFIIFVFLFMASSTAFADGIVPVINLLSTQEYYKISEYQYNPGNYSNLLLKVYVKNGSKVEEYKYNPGNYSDVLLKVYVKDGSEIKEYKYNPGDYSDELLKIYKINY